MKKIFSHQKSSISFVLALGAVQTCRNFFPLGNPPYSKKNKRDSLYFDWLPGSFKSATFFFSLFVQQWGNKDSIMYQGFYLFVSLFNKDNVVLTSEIEYNFNMQNVL